MKRIFFFLSGKEVCEMNQCKIANYDLILTVLLLFALIFFKHPQQYNHPPIYGGHAMPSQVTLRDHMIKQSCDFADRKPSL